MRSWQHINKYKQHHTSIVSKERAKEISWWHDNRDKHKMSEIASNTPFCIDWLPINFSLSDTIPQQTRWWLLISSKWHADDCSSLRTSFPGPGRVIVKHEPIAHFGHQDIDIAASSLIASPGHESIYRVKAGAVVPLASHECWVW